jgi:hypothetical protein
MSFQIHALDPAPFRTLFGLSDAELKECGAVRMPVSEDPGFPCRVGLRDMPLGRAALLLSYRHFDAASPYRASGPVFVEEGAQAAAQLPPGVVPEMLRRRLLSLRAYDAAGMMRDADVVEGAEAETLLTRFFGVAEIVLVHAHFARRGCFAAAFTRA